MVATLIILALCIPAVAWIMGHFVMKSMQHGLKWQLEMKQEQKPTMDTVLPNPFEARPKEQPDLTPSILEEWLNGPKEVN